MPCIYHRFDRKGIGALVIFLFPYCLAYNKQQSIITANRNFPQFDVKKKSCFREQHDLSSVQSHLVSYCFKMKGVL